MPPLVAYSNVSQNFEYVGGYSYPLPKYLYKHTRWPSLVLLLGVCANEVTDEFQCHRPTALWFTMLDGVPDKLCIFPADES